MIDKKKIKEAAVEQLENLGAYGLDEVDLGKENLVALYREEDVKAMFIAGIYWFLKNLWHDASEEPKMYKSLLVEYQDKSVILLTYSRKGTWNYVVNNKIKKRWLYIEDLIKGGE